MSTSLIILYCSLGFLWNVYLSQNYTVLTSNRKLLLLEEHLSKNSEMFINLMGIR
jgi:hypothetical protein